MAKKDDVADPYHISDSKIKIKMSNDIQMYSLDQFYKSASIRNFYSIFFNSVYQTEMTKHTKKFREA